MIDPEKTVYTAERLEGDENLSSALSSPCNH